MRRPESLTPGLLAVLGFMAATAPLATDFYLPSFTNIAEDLGVPASGVQLTLMAFMFGMAAGQIVLGPLSDRLGRRRVLLVALSVFALASVVMPFSPTLTVFVVLRFVQGLSGAAGVVISRAIAADFSKGETAVRALSLIAVVTSLGPLIAPPIGGAIVVVADWRVVLGVIAAAAVVLVIVVWLVVPESLPPERRHTGGVGVVIRTLRTAATAPGFAAYALTFAFAFAAMISYISASSFVAQSVIGMSAIEYSFAYAVGSSGLILMNLVSARWAPRVGPKRMLNVGILLQALAAGWFLVFVLTGSLSAWSFIVGALFIGSGAALCMANGSALALAQTPTVRGSGSALLGGAQFIVGAIGTPLVGLWGEGTALPMVIVVGVAVVLAVIVRSFAPRISN